jgi:hypothetical protein
MPQETPAAAHGTAGSTPPAGVPSPQRSRQHCVSVNSPHRRIGECVDLSCDCLRSTAPQQWAIHVPLGKLKTERMVPVDSFACELVQRLAFFRSLDPLPADGRPLARPRPKKRSFINSVITCISSATPFASPPASSSSAATFLCHRDAASRGGLSCPDEITRPHFSRDDHALRRCGVDRSPAGIPTGSFPTPASCSRTKDAVRTPSNCPRWSRRLFARCSTCAGDVPPSVAKRPFARLPRPALQPAHQDSRRSTSTPHALRMGRD